MQLHKRERNIGVVSINSAIVQVGRETVVGTV